MEGGRRITACFSWTYVSIGRDKQNFECQIANIFLPINFNMCFVCLKEPSHGDGSFEYLQQMFKWRNKKIIFLFHSFLSACVSIVEC